MTLVKFDCTNHPTLRISKSDQLLLDNMERAVSSFDSSSGTQPQFYPVQFAANDAHANPSGPNMSVPPRSPVTGVWMETRPSGFKTPPPVAPINSVSSSNSVARFGDPADDLPLLEELGIFPDHIWAKSQAVLHPLRPMSESVVEDGDLAGPLVFALALGFLLTLQGKMHFGAIYGLSVSAIILGYWLLVLMSDMDVKLQLVISTLGYCLLPNLLLAVGSTCHLWIAGKAPGIWVLLMAALCVVWSSWSATKMFTRAFSLDSKKHLILYPTLLMYLLFAALTIF